VALLGADPRVSRLRDGRWVLVARPTGSPRVQDCSFAVVDVETTGSRPSGGDRVTEIAVVTLARGVAETVYHSLINPERPIPGAVSAVTRITHDMVQTAPTFAEVADDILAALAGRVFVAHNVGFDWRFVSAELRRTRGLVLDGPAVCTVRLARRLIAGLKSKSLDSVAAYYGIEISERHRAGPDALATAKVLARLLDAAAEREVETLHQLVALGRQRGRRRKRKRSALPRSVDEI
jgi:DNA polymerase III subunit epsilon